MSMCKWAFCVVLLSAVLADTTNSSPNTENGVSLAIQRMLKSLNMGKNIDLAKILPNHKKTLEEVVANLSSATTKEGKVAIINEFTDRALVHLNALLVENSVDPLPLQDMETGFEFKFLLIKYSAKIGLTDGLLHGVGSMKRSGDVTLRYQYPELIVDASLGFNRLSFTYDYLIKFMGLGPTGGVDGSVDGTHYNFVLKINLTNLQAKLEDFDLDRLGTVNLRFNGQIWFDWFVNLCIKFAIIGVKPILKFVIESFVYALLTGITGIYNGAVCQVLGDCPAEVLGFIF